MSLPLDPPPFWVAWWSGDYQTAWNEEHGKDKVELEFEVDTDTFKYVWRNGVNGDLAKDGVIVGWNLPMVYGAD